MPKCRPSGRLVGVEACTYGTFPLVVLNTIALLMLGALSWKLFRNYAGTAFSNVGTSPVVQRAYKLVLFFSVALQLASFFAAVSIGLWIAKAGHGSWKSLAEHGNVYLAAFIVMHSDRVSYRGWSSYVILITFPLISPVTDVDPRDGSLCARNPKNNSSRFLGFRWCCSVFRVSCLEVIVCGIHLSCAYSSPGGFLPW